MSASDTKELLLRSASESSAQMNTLKRDKYNPALKAERDRMYASRLAAVQQVPTRLTNASTKGTYQPPAWPSYRRSAADDVASMGVAC